MKFVKMASPLQSIAKAAIELYFSAQGGGWE